MGPALLMSLCLGFGTAKEPGSNLEGGGKHARWGHREERTGQEKGQEKGAAGGCGVFRVEASGDKIGLRGQERRGEPTQGKHTEGPGWRGPSLGAPSEGRAKAHLILRILKHVAHTTLVFLKSEEDVPQPQGRHEDHEGIKRQVPEIDGVEEHGAAAAAGSLALTQGAEERPAASLGAKSKHARVRGRPASPRARRAVRLRVASLLASRLQRGRRRLLGERE